MHIYACVSKKTALVVYTDFKMGAAPKFKSDFDKTLNAYIRLRYLKQLLWFIRISKWEQHPNKSPKLIRVKCIFMPAFLKTAFMVYTDFKMGATPKY